MALSIGTLTRRLEAVLDDFRRARSTWQELSGEGFSVANAVVNSVIQSRYTEDTSYWHPALLRAFPNITSMYSTKMDTLIAQHHTKLKNIYEKMTRQYTKMIQQQLELRAICKRATEIQGNNYVDNVPVYKSCPMRTFEKGVNDIVKMYKEAMASLESLLGPDGFTQIKTREQGVALLSVWINNPSLNDNVIQQFDELCRLEFQGSARR